MSQRTSFTGSALVRLLVRLTDIDVPDAKRSFSDRLSQWFGWTDDISLSTVMNGSPAPAPSGARASNGSAEEAELARVRAALVLAIADKNAFPHAEAAMDTTADFTPHRRRYLARQQAMETRIAPLRAHVRTRLAAKSPAMAQLAALDVVMEQVLGPKEHSLLATVPALLGKHFERLQKAHQAQVAAQAAQAEHAERALQHDAPDADHDYDQLRLPAAHWLDVFGKDMHAVLLAELDIRLQPVEGLLEALRSR